MSDFRWATVDTVAPLNILLDGDATPTFISDCLIDPQILSNGDRVRCEVAGTQLIIHGKKYES